VLFSAMLSLVNTSNWNNNSPGPQKKDMQTHTRTHTQTQANTDTTHTPRKQFAWKDFSFARTNRLFCFVLFCFI